MSVEDRIEHKLRQALSPRHLQVENESHRHNVPPGSESHFHVTVVAERFSGQDLLTRHREIHRALAEELSGPVHALAVHAYSWQEWTQRESAPASPPCLGGDAR